MNISRHAVATTLAIAGLVFSASASALPGFSTPAPESSIQSCVAQIGEQANYDNAGRVHHEVETTDRRVSGHKMNIKTTVYDLDSGAAIREYATICAVSGQSETKKFKIREKSL